MDRRKIARSGLEWCLAAVVAMCLVLFFGLCLGWITGCASAPSTRLEGGVVIDTARSVCATGEIEVGWGLVAQLSVECDLVSSRCEICLGLGSGPLRYCTEVGGDE